MNSIKYFWELLRANRTAVILTFELFWIAIFLLDRLGHHSTGGVPQFVYVNF